MPSAACLEENVNEFKDMKEMFDNNKKNWKACALNQQSDKITSNI